MKAIGKPYAGKPHVRFDEGVQVKQVWLKYKPQPNNVTPDPTLLAIKTGLIIYMFFSFLTASQWDIILVTFSIVLPRGWARLVAIPVF